MTTESLPHKKSLAACYAVYVQILPHNERQKYIINVHTNYIKQ